MKKRFIIFFLCLSIGCVLFLGFFENQQNYKEEYLRIHIRANSNSEIDQSIKYKIKDEYRFYIDDKTGMIYERQTNDCADELYPLFIPLSLGEDVSIKYEIHFPNVGINSSDYIFSGNYHLYCLNKEDNMQYGSVLSYKYTQIFDELEEVEYA